MRCNPAQLYYFQRDLPPHDEDYLHMEVKSTETIDATGVNTQVHQILPQALKTIGFDEAANEFERLAPIRSQEGAKKPHSMVLHMTNALWEAENRAHLLAKALEEGGNQGAMAEAEKYWKSLQSVRLIAMAVTNTLANYLQIRSHRA